MAVEFRLPDLGEGITEGELVRWLVKPGDTVTLDQAIAEVQTDKAVVEMPSPVAGTILSLDVPEGQLVPVGTVLLTIEDRAQDAIPATAPTQSQRGGTARESGGTGPAPAVQDGQAARSGQAGASSAAAPAAAPSGSAAAQ